MCVCSLSYPACKRMLRITSSVACPPVPYFPHYLINGMAGKKLFNTIICFDFFYKFV